MAGPLNDPYAGWTKLGGGDALATGLVNPGPLGPALAAPGDPAQNIRSAINPRGTVRIPPFTPGAQPLSPMKPGPDIVGRAKSWLTKEPPAGSRTMFGETDLPGRIVRGLGDLMLPGSAPEAAGMAATLPIGGGMVTGPLMRAGAGAAAAGGTAALQGRENPLGEAARFGGSQLVGEGIGGALRALLTQRSGKALLSQQREKIASDTATHEAAKAQFPLDVTAHAERGAKSIADAYKLKVPAWKDYPSDTKGLLEMVYGRGQQALSESFDKALGDVVKAGKGKMVNIRAEDAAALGLGQSRHPSQPGFQFPTGIATRHEPGAYQRGPLSPALAPNRPEMMSVDAGALAEKITGTWARDPSRYRRVFSVLDEAGLGNEAARSEYKAGQALIAFMDRTKGLEGMQLRPDRIEKGLTDLRKVNELRRRGEGDVFRGPMAEAATGIPKPPVERAGPLAPAMPEGVKTRTTPNIPWYVGGGLGAGLVGALSGEHMSHYGPAAVAGALAARLLSGRELVTRAPLSPVQDLLTRRGPTLLGQDAREYFRAPQQGPPFTNTPSQGRE